MSDDAEILDWGGEEDEHYGEGLYRPTSMGDADDVVSIGGEEDDMKELAAFQSRSLQDNGNDDSPTAVGRPLSVLSGKVTPRRDTGDALQPAESPTHEKLYDSSAPRRTPSRRSQSQSHSLKAPLTHALPPKPAVAPAPSYRPRTQPHSGFIGASVMSNSRRTQDKEGNRRRANGSSKQPVSDALPADWVIRHSTGKGGETGEAYYYNVRTDQSQWERPTFSDLTGKASPLSPRDLDKPDYQDSRPDSRLAVNRISGEVLSDRRSVAPITRGRDKSRPTSPAHELSYDDRHYRPANGPDTSSSRGLQMNRRDNSPSYVQNQNPSRDDAFNSPSNSHDPGRDSLPTRAFSRQTGPDDPRPRRNSFSAPLDVPPFSREDSRGGGPIRPPRVSVPDRGLRHNGSMQDLKTRPQRFGNAFEGDASPHAVNQFRNPPPHSGDAVPSSHRRYRSRSPPPHLRDPEPYRNGNDPVPGFDNSFSSRVSYPRTANGRPAFQQSGSAQRPAWNPPAQNRRDVEVPPIDFEPPPRRPRDPEYTPKTSMGVDAKRRRLDDRIGDSTHPRRDRSPSPTDSRSQIFSSTTSTTYPGGRDEQQRGNGSDFRQQRRSTKNYNSMTQEGSALPVHNMGLPDIPRDGNIDGRSVNNGAIIPSGPRIRNTPRPTIDTEFRETVDLGRRQLAPAGPSAFNQQPGKQNRYETRRFDGGRTVDRPPDMDRAPEPMDVDAQSRSRFNGPPQNGGSMYSDHMLDDRRDSMDNLPTGPRTMHSKGSVPPSPSVNMPVLPPQGNLTTSDAASFIGRNSPPPIGSRGRRQTRFGGRTDQQQPFGDRVDQPLSGHQARDFSVGRDVGIPETRRHEPPIAAQIEPPRMHDRQPPLSSGPRFPHGETSFPKKPSSSMGTGANDIPVPPRKGWQAGADAIGGPHEYPERAWDESTRAPRGIEKSSAVDRGPTSPEIRYNSLHGDVQRRVSLSDRNNAAEERVPRRLSEPDQNSQKDQLPARGFKNARGVRVSRFSKPQDSAPATAEATSAPRVWISREEATDPPFGSQSSDMHRSERQAPSPPPRSAETIRSSQSAGAGYARQNQALGMNVKPRDRSPGSVSDRRMNMPPPSTSFESPRSRASLDLRDLRQGGMRNSPYGPHDQSRPLPSSPPSASRPLYNRMGDPPPVVPQGGKTEFGGTKGNYEVDARDDRSANDSAASMHPARLQMIIDAPGKIYRVIEPHTMPPPAFRIKRPHSKFLDAPQRNTAHDSNKNPDGSIRETSAQPPRNDYYERPNQYRSNSLLERLSMNAESDIPSASQPSLRDRVELPPKWNDDEFNDDGAYNTSGTEGAYFSGYGDGNRRGQGRGRGRGGRPRRGRGRGSFGALNDS